MGISGTAKMRKNDLILAIKDAQGGAARPARSGESTGGNGTRRSAPDDAAEEERPSRAPSQPAAAAREDTGQSASQDAEPAARQSRERTREHPRDQFRDQTRDHSGGSAQERGGPAPERLREQAPRADDARHERRGDQVVERRESSRPSSHELERQPVRESSQASDRTVDRQPSRDATADRRTRETSYNRDQRDNREQPDIRRGRDDQDDDRAGNRRRSRQRSRDRKRRGTRPTDQDFGSETVETVTEDDVIVPVAGILDVMDSYAFVRTSGYLPGPNDVYVPLGTVRRHGLRKGDAVTGAVKALREGEQPPARQKFNALVRLDTVNGKSPEEAKGRVEFNKLTPLYPQERLRLETEPNILTTRIIDLVSPIGKGQRGLIVSPPKAGKTLILQAIANAISTNNPEAHLMVVLVDERPEEVTDMQRTVKGEVIASTFDRPADDHTTVAELAIERAKRLVELGHDVVVLLDSITRLGRAYNLAAPASGRILSGGVDSSALYPPKRFFGAARNIENGGSLTILATALVETGSKMDEVIFEEFKGTGNMELRLSRQLADRRIFPAVDVNPSGTRREEILMGAEELKIMWKLRRVLSGLDAQQGIELLINRLKKTKSNVEFLMVVQKTSNIHGDDD